MEDHLHHQQHTHDNNIRANLANTNVEKRCSTAVCGCQTSSSVDICKNTAVRRGSTYKAAAPTFDSADALQVVFNQWADSLLTSCFSVLSLSGSPCICSATGALLIGNSGLLISGAGPLTFLQ